MEASTEYPGVKRGEGYAVGRQWGLFSANDVRALEDMNPLPGDQGNIYLTPMNMIPADRLHQVVDKQVAPAPAPVPKPKAPAMSAAPPRSVTPDVIAAHRAVLVEALQRMLRKEGHAARRVAKRGQAALRAWQKAFYAKHERDVAAAVRAAVHAHVAQIGGLESPDAVAARLAHRYVTESRAALAELAGAPPELENAVDLLARRWETTRAELLADSLMTEEVRHALAHPD